MSGFSSDWLALREPLDLAARNSDAEMVFFDALPEGPVRILDLASGAGSTVAALTSRLGRAADWQLTDYDPALLAIAQKRWPGVIACRRIDLQTDLEQLPFDDVDAVTTSAFLDLVSAPFLERLAGHVVSAQKPFLASLTYDGRTNFEPAHPMDETLLTALNRHQRTDKGFGPALGPEAAQTAISLFEAKGCRVVQGHSDWEITPGSSGFLMEFLGGWLRVGRELKLPEDTLLDWWRDREAMIRSGKLSMSVGHIDFVALPPA
ncbi:class I SAM-dependent methyltransferase [Roseibium sediminicola]|uniref:Class I SAM-dependent methyltransferase n=1 Tax=Roseibium sediminicola TaxID=2933272 RepID=A0ABT0H2N1_9HYPH|nr:class I SAM-dependent methyltransferase [Roseibium sp. CAU 1639]MCK7615552.1 class I SAM-dependent methyltransferase [Roseibium sp. CAU 1639]